MLNWAMNKAGNGEGRDLLVLLEPDVGGIEAETHTGIGREEEERRSVEIRPEIDVVTVVLSPASFHIFSKLSTLCLYILLPTAMGPGSKL
jgi:hypothetical protein